MRHWPRWRRGDASSTTADEPAKHLYVLGDTKRMAARAGLPWPGRWTSTRSGRCRTWPGWRPGGPGPRRTCYDEVAAARWQRGENICDPAVLPRGRADRAWAGRPGPPPRGRRRGIRDEGAAMPGARLPRGRLRDALPCWGAQRLLGAGPAGHLPRRPRGSRPAAASGGRSGRHPGGRRARSLRHRHDGRLRMSTPGPPRSPSDRPDSHRASRFRAAAPAAVPGGHAAAVRRARVRGRGGRPRHGA